MSVLGRGDSVDRRGTFFTRDRYSHSNTPEADTADRSATVTATTTTGVAEQPRSSRVVPTESTGVRVIRVASREREDPPSGVSGVGWSRPIYQHFVTYTLEVPGGTDDDSAEYDDDSAWWIVKIDKHNDTYGDVSRRFPGPALSRNSRSADSGVRVVRIVVTEREDPPSGDSGVGFHEPILTRFVTYDMEVPRGTDVDSVDWVSQIDKHNALYPYGNMLARCPGWASNSRSADSSDTPPRGPTPVPFVFNPTPPSSPGADTIRFGPIPTPFVWHPAPSSQRLPTRSQGTTNIENHPSPAPAPVDTRSANVTYARSVCYPVRIPTRPVPRLMGEAELTADDFFRGGCSAGHPEHATGSCAHHLHYVPNHAGANQFHCVIGPTSGAQSGTTFNSTAAVPPAGFTVPPSRRTPASGPMPSRAPAYSGMTGTAFNHHTERPPVLSAPSALDLPTPNTAQQPPANPGMMGATFPTTAVPTASSRASPVTPMLAPGTVPLRTFPAARGRGTRPTASQAHAHPSMTGASFYPVIAMPVAMFPVPMPYSLAPGTQPQLDRGASLGHGAGPTHPTVHDCECGRAGGAGGALPDSAVSPAGRPSSNNMSFNAPSRYHW